MVTCPLQQTVSKLTKKWLLITLNQIDIHGIVNFNVLLKEIEGITPKALSISLKELQAMGLIKRKIMQGYPPKVVYELTKQGKELRKSILPFLHWVASYTKHYDCPMLIERN